MKIISLHPFDLEKVGRLQHPIDIIHEDVHATLSIRSLNGEKSENNNVWALNKMTQATHRKDESQTKRSLNFSSLKNQLAQINKLQCRSYCFWKRSAAPYQLASVCKVWSKNT